VVRSGFEAVPLDLTQLFGYPLLIVGLKLAFDAFFIFGLGVQFV
jgi:hypothetical protein